MKQNKETLKKHFETGDKPTQEQYADLIDSYVDSKQPSGEANRRFVIDEKGEVSVASEKIAPVYTLSDIVANKLSLLKDGEVVKEIDLTTYVDDTNLARLVSGEVDENGLATFTRDDNSTFTVDLSNLKGVVPQYQAGTNISIDSTDPQNPIINVNGGSGGAITDLSYNSTTRTIGSSTGEGTVLPLVNTTNAGLMKADFYEEGVFTPTFVDQGGGAVYNQPAGSTIGKYIRIGNNVSISLYSQNLGTTGVPTGRFQLSNVPFPMDAQSISSFNISRFSDTSLTIEQVQSLGAYNVNVLGGVIVFVDRNSSVLIEDVTLNNSDIFLAGSYKTNVYTP
ncbi:hypothetical protein PG911_18565 [Tenacibaculum ovolyticum]|uniref:hypothetical protein n=1 Tax=Tenacibaculum ovolyticum TaxID=104270 RepID=UPI0022F3C6BB|nr:hypothetical protein [Tenacibaculum ovolyticum]WBX76591.1 hypothetical protein PG911_18565 [Tenacibaculum ovolyticum]